MWVQLKRGLSGDGCVLVSTLYDLRKGDYFVFGWSRLQRVKRGSVFRAANVSRCAPHFVLSSCG